MKKRILAVVCAAAFATAVFAGCGSTSSSTSSAKSTTTASSEVETPQATASVEDVGGFEEQPIWEGAELPESNPLLSMNGVYFQAVTMTGGYEDISGYDIHIEADISAVAGNTLGYGAGDWIPYLSVDYSITDPATGEEVVGGNFMPMSASDGPHYGANIALDPGTYDITIMISPQEDVYLIHTDAETGPAGGGHSFDDYFADGALVFTYEGWDFPGLEQ